MAQLEEIALTCEADYAIGCYVSVTPESRFLVSSRIREEFENGREYYKLHGTEVELPARPELRPSFEYLDWHASDVFRG
jgi:putative restriction endonuclease